MDSGVHVFTCSNNKKEIEFRTRTLHNSTNFNISLFEKVPINQLFTKEEYKNKNKEQYKQLTLFDL